MAQQNFPNVTLSMTLPISCHVCLGKVRQPVVCANHHVFCSTCIEMWLKTASQCPACRVAITQDNPCREIIGGTNDSEPCETHSIRRKLRKTRAELLLKEYEDEIEGLLKENEDLTSQNQSLESQLRTVLEPSPIALSQKQDRNIDLNVLEEWANKLRAATDRYCEVKQEMERLKEANKTLRSQNIDLVQENMRLKSEVASRSPQKFGRYTVAALEAKIHQHERDLDHLRRALERSDQYIEDLEAQAAGTKNRGLSDQREAPAPGPETQLESQENGEVGVGAGACVGKQRISAMRRSLSDMETTSICTNLEGLSQTIPGGGRGSLLLTTTSGLAVPDQSVFGGMLSRLGGKDTKSPTSDPFLPSTPASAFRSLSLKSPQVLEDKPGSKPPSYLRRLSFEDCSGENKRPSFSKLHRSSLSPACSLEAGSSGSKPAPWAAWQRSDSTHLTGTSEPEQQHRSPQRGETDARGSSSEASMDAAYLDKISELDSMMLEGESTSSRGSQLSLVSLRSADSSDFNATLVPEPRANDDELPALGRDPVAERRPSSPKDRPGENGSVTSRDVKPTSSPYVAPAASTLTGAGDSPGAGDDGPGLGLTADTSQPSQTDELSFDLLFDPPSTENKEGGFAVSPTSSDTHLHDSPSPASSSSSGCHGRPGNTTRDRHAVSNGHPTKRTHSPFSLTSPSKLSKYM
ncbi:ORC ubiquitin ligase 1 [Osmerus mordax]|uniref:ORC ubiquitin ligase 1 n=1 Tax=Osmerus mordax TaxID=8014 RepID=UPI00350F6D7C